MTKPGSPMLDGPTGCDGSPPPHEPQSQHGSGHPRDPQHGPHSLHDQYALLVNQLQHEDNLANARTQWALVVQSLLVAGAATLIQTQPAQIPVAKLALLVILGMAVAVAAGIGVRASEQQQLNLCRWWTKLLAGRSGSQFPPFYHHEEKPRRTSPSSYFFILAVLWPALAFGVAPHMK